MGKKKNKASAESFDFACSFFNLMPEIELKKKEKKILRALFEYDDMDFYSLCEWLDMKPSKLDECLDVLDCFELIDYEASDDALLIRLTPMGERLCGTSKKEKKADKQLMKFLASLSDEELEEFCDMCTEVLDEPFAEDATVEIIEMPLEIEAEPEPEKKPVAEKKPAAEKKAAAPKAEKKPAAKTTAKKPAAKAKTAKTE